MDSALGTIAAPAHRFYSLLVTEAEAISHVMTEVPESVFLPVSQIFEHSRK